MEPEIIQPQVNGSQPSLPPQPAHDGIAVGAASPPQNVPAASPAPTAPVFSSPQIVTPTTIPLQQPVSKPMPVLQQQYTAAAQPQPKTVAQPATPVLQQKGTLLQRMQARQSGKTTAAPIMPVSTQAQRPVVSGQQPPQQPAVRTMQPSIAQPRVPRPNVMNDMIKKGVLAGVVIVLAVAVMALLWSVFTGNSLGNLVVTTTRGVRFSRPEALQKTETADAFAYYTPEGADIDSTDTGLFVTTKFIGIKYVDLSADSKADLPESVADQLTSSSTSFTGAACNLVGPQTVTQVQQTGYDVAHIVTAECTDIKSGEKSGAVKMFVGWRDVHLHLVGVVATTDVWNTEGGKIDTVLESVKPALESQ